MAGLVPHVGEELALKNLLNHTPPQDQVVKLFVNNVTPSEGDTAATYTEMSTQGYASKALTGASWVVTPGAPPSAAYSQQTWTFDGTGGATVVYGYFIVQAWSGELIGAERFDVPPTMSNNGDQIKVTPKLRVKRGSPA